MSSSSSQQQDQFALRQQQEQLQKQIAKVELKIRNLNGLLAGPELNEQQQVEVNALIKIELQALAKLKAQLVDLGSPGSTGSDPGTAASSAQPPKHGGHVMFKKARVKDKPKAIPETTETQQENIVLSEKPVVSLEQNSEIKTDQNQKGGHGHSHHTNIAMDVAALGSKQWEEQQHQQQQQAQTTIQQPQVPVEQPHPKQQPTGIHITFQSANAVHHGPTHSDFYNYHPTTGHSIHPTGHPGQIMFQSAGHVGGHGQYQHLPIHHQEHSQESKITIQDNVSKERR